MFLLYNWSFNCPTTCRERGIYAMSDTIRQALQQSEAPKEKRERKNGSRIKRNSDTPRRGCQTAESAFWDANQWLRLSATPPVRLLLICRMQILIFRRHGARRTSPRASLEVGETLTETRSHGEGSVGCGFGSWDSDEATKRRSIMRDR